MCFLNTQKEKPANKQTYQTQLGCSLTYTFIPGVIISESISVFHKKIRMGNVFNKSSKILQACEKDCRSSIFLIKIQ